MSDPAAEVLRLTELERALAAEGGDRAYELAAVQDERARAIAALPAIPAPGQISILTRAYAAHQEAAALLRAERERILAELGQLGQGRTALRGYTPAGGAARRSFDAAA